MMDLPELIATFIGGVCWIIVYIACIVIGFRQHTYCMPLFPLCMNLIWEFCESGTTWNLIWQEDGSFLLYSQFAVFSIWFLLDVVIFTTYCMYGRKYFPDLAQPYFVSWILVVFVISAAICLAVNMTQGEYSTNYMAWIGELLMAILLPVMLFQRGSTEGQSLWIAIPKLIGSELWAYVEIMYYWHYSGVGELIAAILVLFLDVAYIYLLYRVNRIEKDHQALSV